MCSSHGRVYIIVFVFSSPFFRFHFLTHLSLSGDSATWKTLSLGSPPLFVICTSGPSAKNVGHACGDGNWTPHIPTVQVKLTLHAGRTFLKRLMSATTHRHFCRRDISQTWRYRYIRNAECWCFIMCVCTQRKNHLWSVYTGYSNWFSQCVGNIQQTGGVVVVMVKRAPFYHADCYFFFSPLTVFSV